MRSLILTASLLAATAAFAAAPAVRTTATPNLSLLNAILAVPGTQARVVGYVVDSKACPTGAGAKPCTGPVQVFLKDIINEAPAPGLSMPPTPTLIVAVPDAAAFAKDKPYRFEIVTESERTGGVNARMLRFQLAAEMPWPDAATR